MAEIGAEVDLFPKHGDEVSELGKYLRAPSLSLGEYEAATTRQPGFAASVELATYFGCRGCEYIGQDDRVRARQRGISFDHLEHQCPTRIGTEGDVGDMRSLERRREGMEILVRRDPCSEERATSPTCRERPGQMLGRIVHPDAASSAWSINGRTIGCTANQVCPLRYATTN